MPIDCKNCHAPCCRHIGSVMPELDRGDGVCKHLDTETNRCRIYERRPFICDTDRIYARYFEGKVPRAEYDELNRKACEALRSGNGNGLQET